MSASILHVNNAALTVGKSQLLSEVSFSLQENGMLAVIGPNGAGKSSLIRAVTGIGCDERGISGQVLFNDQPLKNMPPEIRARHVAVLPQYSSLDFPFLVEEVIALGRLPHSSGVVRDREIVREIAAKLDIQHLLKRSYPTLSGGEKQRTQLARVFTQLWEPVDNTPRLLLLDEPLNSLDVGHQLQLMNLLKGFAEQGIAVLVVLHDINIAIRYADRLLALKNGKQLEVGPVDKILTESLLQSLFDIPAEIIRQSSSMHPLVVFGHQMSASNR